MDTQNLLGGSWLAAQYAIEPVMPLATFSRIGSRRSTLMVDGVATETYTENMRPSSTLRGHLTFHLKHEVPNLELLSRVFERIEPLELVAWVAEEPSGQYARRAGFFYEFLTGQMLAIDAEIAGGYVDLIDDKKLVAAPRGQSVQNRRWRVRDNLPGTRMFCPMVRMTTDSEAAMALNVPALINELALEFGDDLLIRSSVWLSLRESKSSFAIEGEADQSDRIQRFADVLARRTGEGSWPLDHVSLAALQSEILGKRSSLEQFGIRQSPVFVGEVVRYQEVVHYIAPPAADVQTMLDGLLTFLKRTEGQSAVMRCAVASFGFVYIHPLADGNGRAHRFLINDALRRDGAVNHPMILPVSLLITRDQVERRAYDQILDEISRPLMSSLAGLYEFSNSLTAYPDGVRSNFICHGNNAGRHVWRFPDMTKHVIYLSHLLKCTINEGMREESVYLRSHAMARAAIKEIVEMPDIQIDRIIRSVEANRGKLSNVLAEEMPILTESGVWEAITLGIEKAFQPLERLSTTH